MNIQKATLCSCNFDMLQVVFSFLFFLFLIMHRGPHHTEFFNVKIMVFEFQEVQNSRLLGPKINLLTEMYER